MVSHVDFGGAVPASVLNLVQSRVMPAMLTAIRELAPAVKPHAQVEAQLRAFKEGQARRKPRESSQNSSEAPESAV